MLTTIFYITEHKTTAMLTDFDFPEVMRSNYIFHTHTICFAL